MHDEISPLEYADEPVAPEDGGSAAEPHAQQQQESETPKTFLQWTPETVQTPEMESAGIAINTVARVVVCLAC